MSCETFASHFLVSLDQRWRLASRWNFLHILKFNCIITFHCDLTLKEANYIKSRLQAQLWDSSLFSVSYSKPHSTFCDFITRCNEMRKARKVGKNYTRRFSQIFSFRNSWISSDWGSRNEISSAMARLDKSVMQWNLHLFRSFHSPSITTFHQIEISVSQYRKYYLI